MNQTKPFFNKLVQSIVSFAAYSLTFLFALFILRTFEIFYTASLHAYPKSLLKFVGFALLSDIFFWLKTSFFLLVLYIPIYFISKRIAAVFYISSIIFICVVHLALLQYFNLAMVPLGADFYAYNLADIKQTIFVGGGFKVSLLIVLFVVIVLLVFMMNMLPKKLKLSKIMAVSFILISIIISLFIPASFANVAAFETEFVNNEAINKTNYFFSQSFNHFFPGENEIDIYADSYIVNHIDSDTVNDAINYVDEEKYPFLHVDSTKDVLSPFFIKTATPPNIVILLVEGLGRAFTNEGAYLGNFTPFIDSLSNRSLYWENFLSEGGRTFAVLPAVLGSLPFAKNGFMEMGDKMPTHLSLISLLRLNNYHTSFYYGGDSKFDNMELFLKKNSLDKLVDERSFPAGYTKMPLYNSFTWGYGDKELFKRYFELQKSVSSKPYLSVILTLSTHSPFMISKEAEYKQRFEERLKQVGIESEKLNEYWNYQKQYSSILYTDDALKDFFSAYSKRSDFANTIFIITGDHRMPEIPMQSKIDRYHVPLIVYSPLLQHTAKFQSISTHFDVTPSILAYLKSNYNIKLPSYVSWVGTGLDTSRNFRNIHSYPIMQTKNDLVDFVSGNMQLNGETVYTLSEGIKSTSNNDHNNYNKLKNLFDRFIYKNNKIINGSALIPDTIYKRYFPH